MTERKGCLQWKGVCGEKKKKQKQNRKTNP